VRSLSMCRANPSIEPIGGRSKLNRLHSCQLTVHDFRRKLERIEDFSQADLFWLAKLRPQRSDTLPRRGPSAIPRSIEVDC
jgi:hypothetical protein